MNFSTGFRCRSVSTTLVATMRICRWNGPIVKVWTVLAKPIKIAGDLRRRSDRQVEGKPVLILLLPRRHAKLHHRFADQVGVRQVRGVGQFQQHDEWEAPNKIAGQCRF